MTVTPESIVTYPEHSVDVILEFPTAQCGSDGNHSEDVDLPEFWIEVFYCGHDVYCGSASVLSSSSIGVHNATASPTLYAELVRGFPRHRLIQLRCELFGLAGNYAVKLRAANTSSTFIGQTAFIKVCYLCMYRPYLPLIDILGHFSGGLERQIRVQRARPQHFPV